MQKYFLYARKSTDVEDKQVLSIDAQITELRAFAKNEKLEIVEEFVEKRTAKIPGRPIFGEMMRRIAKGEVSGIISWHPDRLARNSVDGGQIVYFLDIGNLASLKFPSHWFENTPQGKFSLSMAFVQSKYYVDSLSENTKRGLRQKVRMGIFPSQAPVGYLNDSRTKTIVVEKKNLVLSAWLLNDTRKVINGWKTSQPFWRRTEYQRVPERESQKLKRLLSSPIRSTLIIQIWW